MSLADELQKFAQYAIDIAPKIKTEASTNISLVLPFLKLLNYDTNNPIEVVPEYSAGFKGANDNKRVDFCVFKDGKPTILVECKWCGKQLSSEQCGAQLFQYFAATETKFAIFTNGLVYRFYTDNQKANIMDDEHFLEIDLADLDLSCADILEAFKRENFSTDNAKTKVCEYIVAKQVRDYLSHQLRELDDKDLIRHILRKTKIYNNNKNDIDTYSGIVHSILLNCAKEVVNSQEQPKTNEMTVNKEQTIQFILNSIKKMFEGQIVANKFSSCETKEYTTILYFGIVLCKLRFLSNGELSKIRFMSSDDTYPRKVKADIDVTALEIVKFKDEFAEQIEQVKHWNKKANI